MFVFGVVEGKLNWKLDVGSFEFVQFDVHLSDELVLVFSFLLPVPALDFDALVVLLYGKQFIFWNLDRFPVRVQVIHYDLCPGAFEQGVV
jgi:hypothetical protein